MLVGRAFILHRDKLLLIQRNLDDANNPGLWEIPGGKIDSGELPLTSLIREVKEEVGLNIRPISPTLAGWSYYITGQGKYAGMLYLPLYTVFETNDEVSLGTEHCSLSWLPWAEAVSQPGLTPATAYMLVIMKDWLRR